MRQRREGFSLMELMVVLLVLGILFAISIPAIKAYTTDASFGSAVEQVTSHLRLARFKSISQHANVIVRFSWTAGSYTLHTDTNGNGARDSGEPVRGPFAMPLHVTIANASSGGIAGDTLVFHPDGSLLAAGALVVRSPAPANRTKTITLMRSTGEAWVQ